MDKDDLRDEKDFKREKLNRKEKKEGIYVRRKKNDENGEDEYDEQNKYSLNYTPSKGQSQYYDPF